MRPLFSFEVILLTILTAFDLSDGIATSLTAGFPPDTEPTFDIEEQDLDSDYDDPVEDSAEGDPAATQPPVDVVAPALSERTVKAYIVKYTAYRTFVADSQSLRCVLRNEIQSACDHMVYLFRRDYFLPQ